METTDRHQSAPIFIVGSPRSGTSILTWCLGQHPNILPLEESDWMGQFAVNVGAHYVTGCTRGERSQLAALGVKRAEFFRSFGDGIDRLLHDHRGRLEAISHASAQRNPLQVSAGFSVSRGSDEPKSRWVDGTPEYSLYICGLHKLFPDARFVHIVRDVHDVVASMLGFHQHDGSPLAESMQQACAYWLRTVQACVLAEQALGGDVVCRVQYADLIARPESTLRDVFAFLHEPFMPVCLEPMHRRINSSRGEDAAKPVVAKNDADLTGQARQLSERLRQPFFAGPPSVQALAQFEADFDARVKYIMQLDAQHQLAQQTIARLDRQVAGVQAHVQQQDLQILGLSTRLNWCGVLLALQFLLAIAVNLRATATNSAELWLAVAFAGAIAYLWLRRAGLRCRFKRFLARRIAMKTMD